jgi:eukaryotic-like serine/threonine-protein kinase
MDSHRWQRLKSILAEALELESPAARSALVGRSCADDADLVREIESLLAEADMLLHESSDDLEQCANNLATVIRREDGSEIGKRVGAYVMIREIGQGGMGTVYLAARADGYFEKQVAIKLLNRDAASGEVLRRFRSEREVLARLDHPNIARLIDAGTTNDGLPYFVMEYIEGIPITRFVEEEQKGFAARLRLFLKISAAVEEAHRNSVIHRDLKPTNILVNREGEPKLLDFGIAKVLGGETNPLELTALGQERLTPVSASPEQAQGEPVTVASDIYALGVVLYEMLTGVRPHRFLTRDPSREELVQVVCKQLPTVPSLVVKERERRRLLRGDLDAILLRALQKEPTRRYPSVAEFAEDIRRHLAGKAVRAREHEAAYRIRNLFLHNRRVQLTTGVAAALILLGALFFGSLLRSNFKSKNSQKVSPDSQHSVKRLIPEKSIAVLPFDSLSADQENSYFVDGVQDNILTDLAKVADLNVISRNSVSAYRSVTKNPREIGQALGVSYILEGSIQKSGDRIRVNAQLIDARTEAEVWAEHYDRRIDDLFILESELAQTIVSRLKVTLAPSEKAAIENRPTVDMLAYDFYLRARESFFQSNYRKAVQLLEEAVTRDPRFALAYCLMAEADLYSYRFGGDVTPNRLAKAAAAAQAALRLAPDLAESHLAKAQYYYYGLRDFEKAQRELAIGSPTPSGRAKFIDLAALTERRLGRWKDAVRDGERAVELDPYNPFTANELVESYLSVRRFADAEELADKAIKLLVPRNGYLWNLKSESLIARGRIEEARAVLESSPLDTMDRTYKLARLAMLARDFAKAAALLSNVPPPEGENFDIPFLDGIVARAQGDSTRMQSSFQVARARLAAKLAAQPNDPELLSNLSLVDAGLGRKVDALLEGRRAVELCPRSRDAVEAPGYETMLALVYAWTGEHNAAFSELAEVIKLPRGPNYGEMRCDPEWDEIRTDPRFDTLLNQAALPPAFE